MDIKVISLAKKLNSFSDFWNPRIVGELNGQYVKVAKIEGEFIMHQHEHEDEMFLVIEGKLLMELDNKTLEINPGEFVIIPKGIRHKPIGLGEVKIMLFEPKSTLNTGNIENERTVKRLDKI